ncbi:hypothetical protein CLV47_11823 [Antricoccus suffuscus]|uniref:Uncharacterized protein n=1 Tax=Antricoccus suffuscus TaxID=1629062 RepID=A0A2T0ZTH8_9ACTN|nr:hypothetical protein [Antricoccus suffuscus]PRZ39659.1 hypothetical protein CLV47_11823 [Antricoccus suffuscus]
MYQIRTLDLQDAVSTTISRHRDWSGALRAFCRASIDIRDVLAASDETVDIGLELVDEDGRTCDRVWISHHHGHTDTLSLRWPDPQHA